MNRTRPKLRLLLAVALSFLFVGAAAPAAHATAYTDVVTGFRVDSRVGYQDGIHINAVISYCVPADVRTGDSFSFTMPSQIKFGMEQHFALFPDANWWDNGQPITDSVGPSGSPATYTLHFNAAAVSHAGSCYATDYTTEATALANQVPLITGQLPLGLVKNGQPTDVTLVFAEGSTQFPVTITVNPAQATQPFTITAASENGQVGATPGTAASIGTATGEYVYAIITNTGDQPLTNIRPAYDSLTDGVESDGATCYTNDMAHFFDAAYGNLQPGQTIRCLLALGNVVPGTMSQLVVWTSADYPDKGGVRLFRGDTFETHAMYYVTNEAVTPPVLGSAQVGGKVWNDLNRDNVVDPGEAGLAGVTAQISRTDSEPVTNSVGTAVSSVVTNAQGNYVFDVSTLPYGVTYETTAVSPAGYSQTSYGRGQQTSYADYTTAGASDLSLDFGYYQPTYAIAIVEGDVNGNAADTAETAADLGYEPGSASLVFTITNTGTEPLTQVDITDKVVRGGIVSNMVCEYPMAPVTFAGTFVPMSVGDGTSTDAGSAWDGNFLSGQTITCTADLTQVSADVTHHDDSTVTAIGYAADESSVPVTATNPYFAKVKAAVSVGYTVWLDTNRNGTQDSGELGISGITLALTSPTGDPVADLAGRQVPPVTTDSAGHYVFANLPALPAGQHYTVKVVTATGFTPTLGNTGTAVSKDLTVNGSSDMTLNFGYYPETPITTIDTGLPGLSGTAVANIAGGLGLIALALVGVVVIRNRRRQT